MTTTPITQSSMDWHISNEFVDYRHAEENMLQYAKAIFENQALERVWLLEHPPLYTLGTSANEDDVLDASSLPTFHTGRGGQVTYHGPGQRISYVQVNLNHRGKDLRAYIRNLEEWIILTLKDFGVIGERREGRVGIWVDKNGHDHKIAAIGVRVQKWITLHGIAINNTPDLNHFQGIVPCGLSQFGVTSLQDMGVDATMAELDHALQKNFGKVF